jgi:nitrite reductase/ring-hydroxylating ferredoxin subunit
MSSMPPLPSPTWRTRANAPAPGTRLASLDEVPADNGLERVFGDGPRAFRLVLFRVGDGVRAYVNECPHVSIPFHFSADVFCVYDIDGRRDLMCAHHTAMFHLDDGHCYDGPCRGERLVAVDVVVGDDGVRIA